MLVDDPDAFLLGIWLNLIEVIDDHLVLCEGFSLHCTSSKAAHPNEP